MLTLLMTQTLFATCVALPPSDASVVTVGLPADEDTVELVMYPLGDVMPLDEGNSHRLALFPLGPRAPYESGGVDASFVESVVYEAIPDEFEYEGRMLEVRDGNVLAVRAPHSVQGEVKTLLDGLRAAFRRHADVTVRVFDVLDTQLVGTTPTAESLEQLVRDGALRLIFQRRQDVVVGSTQRLGGKVMRSYCNGWERQIAQGSEAALPMLAALREGVEILLRIEDDGDAQALRLFASSTSLRELESREVSVQRALRLDGSMFQDRRPGVVELPNLATVATGGTRRMHPGEHIVQTLWTRTEAGIAGCVIDVALGEVEPAPGPVRIGDHSLFVFERSRRSWGGVTSNVPSLDGMVPFDEAHIDFENGEGSLGIEAPYVEFPSESFEGNGGFDDALWDAFSDGSVSSMEMGAWTLLVGNAERITRALAAMPAPQPARRRLDLQLGVSESGPRSEVRTRSLLGLAMETASSAFGLVGDTRGFVSSIETDVATDASSTSPIEGEAFDGLAVRATSFERDVLIELALARLDEVGTIGLRGVIGTDLDRPVFTLGEASARVSLDGQRHVIAVIPAGGRELTVWAMASVVD